MHTNNYAKIGVVMAEIKKLDEEENKFIKKTGSANSEPTSPLFRFNHSKYENTEASSKKNVTS